MEKIWIYWAYFALFASRSRRDAQEKKDELGKEKVRPVGDGQQIQVGEKAVWRELQNLHMACSREFKVKPESGDPNSQGGQRPGGKKDLYKFPPGQGKFPPVHQKGEEQPGHKEDRNRIDIKNTGRFPKVIGCIGQYGKEKKPGRGKGDLAHPPAHQQKSQQKKGRLWKKPTAQKIIGDQPLQGEIDKAAKQIDANKGEGPLGGMVLHMTPPFSPLEQAYSHTGPPARTPRTGGGGRCTPPGRTAPAGGRSRWPFPGGGWAAAGFPPSPGPCCR